MNQQVPWWWVDEDPWIKYTWLASPVMLTFGLVFGLALAVIMFHRKRSPNKGKGSYRPNNGVYRDTTEPLIATPSPPEREARGQDNKDSTKRFGSELIRWDSDRACSIQPETPSVM